MKKQFFRVKQLADQTFLRAEKSEVLNHEELQIADQRVDAIRSAITSINKKICPNGPINDREKRLKKCQEYQIGSTFVEEAREEKDCILFQHILRLSGHTEQDLAKDYAEHEAKVEEMVYGPLQKVVEHDLPSILKQKHNLKKYCLDKDSASNRYHSTKKETLKEDMEEADTKVEQSRDQLAIEMFHLLSRENEFASYILQLLKLQRGYHESALKNLETIIPELEKTIGDSHIKKVFGVPLEEHLRVTGKRLAYPLEICITTLLEFGMSEEGLFRIAGGMSKVKRLRAAIDSGCFSCLIPEYRDVHVLASTLKLYLRELPEPLLTFHLHKDWMQSMQYPENQRLEVVKHLLSRLPQENRDNLAYLIQFLARMTQHTENKMTSSNLAIVMAPNLLWNKNEEINVNMGNCVTINTLVELFVKEVNTLFPDDVSGYVTITSLIPDEDVSSRNGNNGKSQLEHVDATSTESLLDSPKPNLRKKKPAAPIPPNPPGLSRGATHEAEHAHQDKLTSSYPSGSTTLNRPPKGRDHHAKVKSTVGVNTEENELSLSRKRSFSKDDIKSVIVTGHSQTSAASTNHVPGGPGHGAGPAPSNVAVAAHVGAVAAPPQNPTNLVSDAGGGATRVVTQAVTSVSKAQPVIKPVAQNVAEEDRSYRTTVTHHVGGPPPPSDGGSSPRPVAAPRQSLMADEKSAGGSTNVSRNSSIRSTNAGDDVMSKSHNSLEYGDVQLRRSEMLEKPAKPEIPARPASLAPAKRSSMDIDPTLHRTQCSVYSVANKQQPSIVNIQNRNEKIQLGHDVMMAEKEKFLGHHQIPKTNLENKFNDINSNKDKPPPRPTSTENKPSIPPKSPSATAPTSKSNEHLLDLSLDLTKASDNHTGGGPQVAVSKSSEKLNEINENKTHHHHRRTSHHTHTRTRSDGNIMELGGHHRSGGGEFLLQTPPSPRSLNKPTEPPPPPPVAVVKKREPESTDF